MLILAQHKNDSITLTLPDGRTMRVVVVSLDDCTVRLGFDAPRDVLIVRDNAINKEPRKH